MQLTITEAAKLYRKQRKTLYRHIDSGRLSCSIRGDGHRVIDLSEMIRCYGEPTTSVNTYDTAMTRGVPASDTLTRAMLEELQALRKEVEQLRADLRRLPPPVPIAPLEQPTESPKPDDPHGFRALVDALRKSS